MPEGVVDPEFLPVSQTIDDPMRSNGPDHEDDGSDDREDDDVGQMSEQAQFGRVTAQTQRPHRLHERREHPPTNTRVDHRQGDLGWE